MAPSGLRNWHSPCNYPGIQFRGPWYRQAENPLFYACEAARKSGLVLFAQAAHERDAVSEQAQLFETATQVDQPHADANQAHGPGAA